MEEGGGSGGSCSVDPEWRLAPDLQPLDAGNQRDEERNCEFVR